MKIRKTKLYNRLIYPMLNIIGFYKFKAKIRKWNNIRILTREDYYKKNEILNKIYNLPESFFSNNITSNSVIISLTSYGNRVEQTLPLALFSLVSQTVKPGKIVVYLDEKNWQDDKLPIVIQHFQRVGVDIRYCEDIRSYKKIIPALRDFPDNPIVTVDDDIYYDSHMLEWLLGTYKKLPQKAVVGLWARIVGMQDGKYMPYNTWQDCKYRTSDSEFALYTGYGTFYPPHIFDDEVKNSKVFMELSPTADDIWMWVMEKRLNIPVYLTPNAGLGLHTSVNRVNVYFPEENSDNLYYVNELMGNKNDEQLNNLINYYHLSPAK